jgi:hypothetical protein
MEPRSNLSQPYTLEYGGSYVRAVQGIESPGPAFAPVRFVAYDACPAFVIVRGEDGVKRRCPRAEIFILR